jgi:mannose-6-phosphate isomerase-like protein (cupin superfamily)
MIETHHEADDEESRTNGREELFAVMTGHAVFTVDGEEIDAPAGDDHLRARSDVAPSCPGNC